MPEKQPVDLQQTVKGMSDAELQQFNTWLITERYRVRADKLDGLPLPPVGSELMPVDGAIIKSPTNKDSVIPSYTDPEQIDTRLALMGQFTGDGRILTVVGSDGRYWVGPDTDQSKEHLKDAKYTEGTFKPIITADHKFTDPDLQTWWETYLNPTDSLIQPDKRETEAPEEKAERLLRNVIRAEFASHQEYSFVSNRSGEGFASIRAQDYTGPLYPHDSYPENYKDSDLMYSEFEKRSWYIPDSIARIIDPNLLTSGLGERLKNRNELYCLVGKKNGDIIIQGGGVLHPDFAHRPNYSSFKLVFDSEDAANEYINWLQADPKVAYGSVLRRATGSYDEQGNFRQALIPPKEFNMGKEKFSDPFSGGPNKVLIKDLRTTDVASTPARPEYAPPDAPAHPAESTGYQMTWKERKAAKEHQELKESLTQNLTSDFREEADGFVLETGSFRGYKISRTSRGGAHGYIYYAQTSEGEPAIIKVAKESATKPHFLRPQETNQIEYAVLDHTSKLLAEHQRTPLVPIPMVFDTASYSNAAFSESLMPGESASELRDREKKYPPGVMLRNILLISELGNLLAGKSFELTLRNEAVELEVVLEKDRRPDTVFLDPETGELTGIIDFSTSVCYTKDYYNFLQHTSSSLPYQSDEYTRAEERRKQLEINGLEGIMRQDSEKDGVKSMGLMAERLSKMEEATSEISSLFERMASGQIPNFVSLYQEIVNSGYQIPPQEKPV